MKKSELMVKYGTDNEKEIIEKKTTEQQEKVFSSRKPKRVEMTAAECKKLCAKVNLDYLEGYEGRVIEHVVTDETVDRDGDIIRAKGVDFKSNYYPKNPTILFAHEGRSFPVGKSLKVWHDSEENNVKSLGLYFDDRMDRTGRADTVFRMVSGGGMPACSIGFMPKEVNRPKDKADREEMGLGEYGVEFVKSEMLEYSPCSVGSNPNALQNMLKALKSKEECQTALETVIPKDLIDDFIQKAQEIYKDFTATIEIKGDPDNGGSFKYCVCTACKHWETHEAGHPCGNCPECGKQMHGSNEKPKMDYNEIPDDKEINPTEKPYPNEHSCRLKPPDKYETCRRSSRKSDGKTYHILTCKLKGKDKWEEQAYRYPKDSWTAAEARKHCKGHNGILFEPAGEAAEILSEYKDEFEERTENAIKKLIETMENLGQKVTDLNITLEPLKDLRVNNPDDKASGDSSKSKSLYDVIKEEGDNFQL